MKRNKIEFKPGDKVTFNPYGTPLKATVKEVDVDQKDERIFYNISGHRVVSTTTGRSIMESVYYEVDDGKF